MTQEAGTPPGFWERVEQIAERAVAKYARSGALRNARISGGNGLTISDGGRLVVEYAQDLGGRAAVYFGTILNAVTGGRLGTGLLVNAQDGTPIAAFYSNEDFGEPLAQIFDGNGDVAFATDAASGQGIARPYIGGQFYAVRWADFRYSVTVNDWTTVARAFIFKQQPQLTVGLTAGTDAAGTTGEVRVMVENVQHGPTTVEGFTNNNRYYTAPVAGEHMEILTVEIQARRTSATGTLKLEPIYWMGRQS